MAQRHEDSDDDTYVTLGSAFEKLETVEDVEKAKRKKDKEHYVTDEQGRRRFHGAFTGGFSAGYYNTVGSKEGECQDAKSITVANYINEPLSHAVMIIIRMDSISVCVIQKKESCCFFATTRRFHG